VPSTRVKTIELKYSKLVSGLVIQGEISPFHLISYFPDALSQDVNSPLMLAGKRTKKYIYDWNQGCL